VAQDRKAWDQAFVRYSPGVLTHIQGLIRFRNWYLLRNDAEDILVATFIRAFEYIPNLRDAVEAAFLAYLRQVAYTCCITELRRTHPEEPFGGDSGGHDPPVADPPSDAFLVNQAVEELAPDLRRVIELTRMGLTWKETCTRLRIPPKEYWRRKYRAFEILRKRLIELGVRQEPGPEKRPDDRGTPTP